MQLHKLYTIQNFQSLQLYRSSNNIQLLWLQGQSATLAVHSGVKEQTDDLSYPVIFYFRGTAINMIQFNSIYFNFRRSCIKDMESVMFIVLIVTEHTFKENKQLK
jgi:hypothetical protein